MAPICGCTNGVVVDADLLFRFGETSGLRTNFEKSSVVPISCEGLNLEDVIGDLAVTRELFPIRYLGLPLTTTRLKRVDFQYVVDKAISKLTAWNARNMTIAARLALTKSVLTSQAVYLLSTP